MAADIKSGRDDALGGNAFAQFVKSLNPIVLCLWRKPINAGL